MKIAIYSGSIPSTTFIEHLIKGIGKTQTVYLFGTVKSPIKYGGKNIQVIETPTILWRNLFLTFKRLLLLVVKKPKMIRVAYKEALKYSSYYERWMRFSRFLPVLLYEPDIFHLQWASEINRWFFLKKAYGCKLIVSLRGAHINYSPISKPELASRYRSYFPKVDAFHAVSEAIKSEAQKYGAIESKIEVIYSLIETSTFLKYQPYTKSTSNKPIRLCCVGRFHWKKGYNYILKACALLNEMGLDFELSIIASNAVTEDVLYIIHTLNLKNKVTILKGLPQDELFDIMQSFDLLVLPSVEEGIANVVLEAMAIGLPVISTDCGGMPEVVIPNQTGWLVPMRNPEAIAEAIVDVKNTSEEDIRTIVQNARDFVNKHFNAEDGMQQFLEFYRKALLHSEC